MKAITAIAGLLVLLVSPAAMAQRAGDAALGAVAGAVVLGPVGAVAGAFVGYTAGPSISRSWGIDGRRSARQRKQTAQDGGVRTARAEAVGTAGSGTNAQAPRAATPASAPAPRPARAAAKTSFPPVQTLD